MDTESIYRVGWMDDWLVDLTVGWLVSRLVGWLEAGCASLRQYPTSGEVRGCPVLVFWRLQGAVQRGQRCNASVTDDETEVRKVSMLGSPHQPVAETKPQVCCASPLPAPASLDHLSCSPRG